MDHLIITADDFGLDDAVNEAVELAHRDGALSAASLMVGGAAAADAVRRARALPTLRVGLHLVIVDGAPVLPPSEIPDLVTSSGRLRADLVGFAVAIAARPAVREQVAREIEAQLDAYAATGLPLDHLNAHKHFHLHPIVADIILSAAHRIGLRGLRVPIEPAADLRRIERGVAPLPGGVTALQARLLARKADRAGLLRPDAVFGLRWSGAMTGERILGVVEGRPARVVEIYAHPAMRDEFPGCAAGYRYRDELAALRDPRLVAAIARSGATFGGYAGIAADAATREVAPAVEESKRRVA